MYVNQQTQSHDKNPQSFEPGELNKLTQNTCWYKYIRMSQISEPDQLLNHNIWISKTCTLIYHSLMFQTLHFIWSENNKE